MIKYKDCVLEMLLRRLRALQVHQSRGTTYAKMSSGLNGELGGSATVDINSIGAASGGRPRVSRETGDSAEPPSVD